MWEIGVNNQATTFLFSILLGIFSALFYDLLKLIRHIKKQKTITIFIIDIFYFLVLTVVFFCFFILRTNGEIRGFVLIGAFIGFSLFKLTISKLFYFILVPARKICEFFENILKIVLKPLAHLRKIVYNRHIKIKRKLSHCQPKKANRGVSY